MYIIHTVFQLNKIFQVFDGVIVYLNIILILITHTNTWYTCMNNFFFYLMHKRIKLFIIIIYCFLYFFPTSISIVCVPIVKLLVCGICCGGLLISVVYVFIKELQFQFSDFFSFQLKHQKHGQKKWMPNKPSLACIYSIFY